MTSRRRRNSPKPVREKSGRGGGKRSRVLTDRDVPRDGLRGRRVAIIGYGGQGSAHARNLRDSGVDVVVGLRPRSRRRAAAGDAGLTVCDPDAAIARADVVMLLVPDEEQGALLQRYGSALRAGNALGFAHGLALRFGLAHPPPEVDLFLVAPKGPGSLLRRRYLAGRGLPAMVAVERDVSGRAWNVALAYGAAIGCSRAGMLVTTFAEEAVTDLFGEQAVLTGGVAELARAAYQTLVEAGYPPEVAYVECVQEIRGVADLLFERGIAGMREAVSSPARWGGARSGRAIIDEGTRRRMRRLLREIESGRTVRWLSELSAREKSAWRSRDRSDPIEKAGRRVRSTLGWLDEDETPAR